MKLTPNRMFAACKTTAVVHVKLTHHTCNNNYIVYAKTTKDVLFLFIIHRLNLSDVILMR